MRQHHWVPVELVGPVLLAAACSGDAPVTAPEGPTAPPELSGIAIRLTVDVQCGEV